MLVPSRVASDAELDRSDVSQHMPGSVRCCDSRSKRTFDIIVAVAALIVLLPLFFSIAILIRFSDGGSPFYRHPRLGRSNTRFDCLKFRTMHVDSQAILTRYLSDNPAAMDEWRRSHKLKDDPRVTSIGYLLRKTSLDELPQLINVISGEMSIVGPRPIVSSEIEKYGHDATIYFSVRPGLTGAWQVSGRSDTTYAERVRLDRAYVETWSLAKDMIIVARTIPAVFFARGSY
ncbi:exopolysaccharide production protein ExoY [Methylobacterium sp. BE186]|uniref:sugar transferase n=1 Tax=Methylobacterium sp. BE186 TaxID=2817715 RepID=UPI002859AC3C|nr:sugar transferase [Methylobacterium sp. BE186]MDR7038592.1 exopolysaccharide production protein ExoY [Methylobacterium sp. BE186]